MFSRFVPESVRYLLLKGKIKETEKVLRHIAHVNKKDYPSDPLHDPTQDGEQKMGDIRDLFRSKKMVHRTLVSWYTWLVHENNKIKTFKIELLSII